VALFYNPASGSTFSSTAIEIIKGVKDFAVAQAKVFPHLDRGLGPQVRVTIVYYGFVIPKNKCTQKNPVKQMG
jgi:hypothetical protein